MPGGVDNNKSTNSAPTPTDIHPKLHQHFKAIGDVSPCQQPTPWNTVHRSLHHCNLVRLPVRLCLSVWYPLACLCWLPPWRPIWGTTRGRPVDWYIGQWPTSTPRKTRLGRLPNCLLVCVPWLVPTTHSYLNDSAIILYHGNQHCIEPQSAVVGLPRNFVLWRTLLGLCHWLHY